MAAAIRQLDGIHQPGESRMNTLIRWGRHGVVAALAAVIAACGGGSNTAAPAAVVATVEIRETGALLQQTGEMRQLTAVARDAQGDELDVPIEWSSGKPAVIGVDATGQLRAMTAAGSSQIIASAQGVRSAPLLAVVTTPAAGAVMVSDEQVLGEPLETDPNAAPSLANTYRVTLGGVAPPALGTLLVGTGSKAVAGRVLAVDASIAGQATVTLARVPLPVLFPHLQLDEVFDLSIGAATYSDAVLAHYTVERVGNTHTFTPKLGVAQNARREHALAGAVGTRQLRELGPLECDDSAVTGLIGDPPPLPVQLSAPPLFTFTVHPTLEVRYTPGGQLERWVVKAQPKLDAQIGVKAALVFEGKLTCKIELFVLPVPVGGALSLVFGGLVPIGAGFEFGGKITLASLELTTKVEASAAAEIGLVCAGGDCGLHTVLDASFTDKETVTLPSTGLGGLRVEPSFAVFGTVEAEIGSRRWRSLRFEAFKTQFGGKLEGNFATRAAQIADTGYESEYKLSLDGKAGIGSDIGELLAALGLANVAMPEYTLSIPLAQSPAGLVTADRANFAVGDTINLKVVLDPATFLGAYNVDRIEWVHQAGGTHTTIATQAASSGQTEFNHAVSAGSAGAAGDYYAFVVTRLPELPLELGRVALSEAPVQACPTYEVDVGGRIGNSPSRVFNVNAQAGFSAPGAYGGAVLGGDLTLSLTSGYAGTALANGDVTYLVESDSPGPIPIDSVWRWSVNSNVDAGGSCTATVSVGGVTRSITATADDLQVLEAPVTVRHGDVLKATLDAQCSSPGLLAGPPETLVNANIGITLSRVVMSGVRFRPVMCIP
jgi:hypothetical protein